MKKATLFVLFLAALLMILPVSAESAVLGSKPVKIVFWHCKSDNAGKLLERYVKEFNESNPWQITVEPIYQGQYSDASTLLKVILSAENYSELPDVIELDATGKVAYFQSGKAFSLDDAEALYDEKISGSFLESVLRNWHYNGVQLGIPFDGSTMITYYNRDLLSQAGWETLPETFDDLIRLSGDMKAAGLTARTYGEIPNTPYLANWLGQLGSSVVNNANGNEAPATQLDCIENGALEKFLSAWQTLYHAGALVNESFSPNDFIAGEVAVYINSSSMISSIKSKVNGAFEVAAGPFLRVSADVPFASSPAGSCVCLFDSGDELRKAASWEFLKFLGGEAFQTAFAAETGKFPANKASLESETWRELVASEPMYGVGPYTLAHVPDSFRSVTVGPSVDFYLGIMNGVSEMLNKGVSPEEGAESIEKNLQSLLDNWTRMNPD